MKVWFFKDRRKSSSGWKNVFYAVTAQGCHMTGGKNLAEAVYMAHDLVACLKDDDDFAAQKFYDVKICRRTFSLGGVAHDD